MVVVYYIVDCKILFISKERTWGWLRSLYYDDGTLSLLYSNPIPTSLTRTSWRGQAVDVRVCPPSSNGRVLEKRQLRERSIIPPALWPPRDPQQCTASNIACRRSGLLAKLHDKWHRDPPLSKTMTSSPRRCPHPRPLRTTHRRGKMVRIHVRPFSSKRPGP